MGMIAYCVNKFMLDEDTSTVKFYSFDGKGTNIYPTLSLCFRGSGIFDNFKIREQTLSKVGYASYLDGKEWDSKLVNVNYDNVSLDARKIVESVTVSSRNFDDKPIFKYIRKGKRNAKALPFKESFRSARAKCYSFELNVLTIPKLDGDQMSRLSLTIKNYHGGVNHFMKKNPGSLNLDIFLTYPNQLMRSFPVMQIKKINEQKGPTIAEFRLYGMEVVQKRSKSNDICKSNWIEDDKEIINDLISKVGCRHNHWISINNLPICQAQEELAKLKVPDINIVDKKFLEEYLSPCRKIQTVIGMGNFGKFEDSNAKLHREKASNGSSFVKLVIHFKAMEYKLIRDVKSFNEESLIGNLGGYCGLFLGFAIWQLPSFFDMLVKKVCAR